MRDSSCRVGRPRPCLSDRLFYPHFLDSRHPASSAVGGKLGGKIVKRRARHSVVASGRLALWSHLAVQFLPLPAVGGTVQHCTGLATAIRPAPAVGTPRSRDEFRVPAPSKDATGQFERPALSRIL